MTFIKFNIRLQHDIEVLVHQLHHIAELPKIQVDILLLVLIYCFFIRIFIWIIEVFSCLYGYISLRYFFIYHWLRANNVYELWNKHLVVFRVVFTTLFLYFCFEYRFVEMIKLSEKF